MSATPLSDALVAILGDEERHVLLGTGGMHTGPGAAASAQYPARVVSCGRGEQTAVLVAAGLAAEGRRPIVFLPGPQMTGRAAALFDALAAAGDLDVMLLILGPLPAGVRPPAAGSPAHAPDEAAGADRARELAQVSGPRVLCIS